MGWKWELPSTTQMLLILAVESASWILFLTCHSVPLSGYDAGLEETLLTRKQPACISVHPHPGAWLQQMLHESFPGDRR